MHNVQLDQRLTHNNQYPTASLFSAFAINSCNIQDRQLNIYISVNLAVTQTAILVKSDTNACNGIIQDSALVTVLSVYMLKSRASMAGLLDQMHRIQVAEGMHNNIVGQSQATMQINVPL